MVWYSRPNNVLEEKSAFHVQWYKSKNISDDEKARYIKIYENLDDSPKTAANNGEF